MNVLINTTVQSNSNPRFINFNLASLDLDVGSLCKIDLLFFESSYCDSQVRGYNVLHQQDFGMDVSRGRSTSY